MFKNKWIRQYLYSRLRKEYDDTIETMELDQNMTDEMIQQELSKQPIHRAMIEAYSKAGLSFFDYRKLKIDRDDFCLPTSKLIQEDQIKNDLEDQCKICENDSQEVRDLKKSLEQLLQVIQIE